MESIDFGKFVIADEQRTYRHPLGTRVFRSAEEAAADMAAEYERYCDKLKNLRKQRGEFSRTVIVNMHDIAKFMNGCDLCDIEVVTRLKQLVEKQLYALEGMDTTGRHIRFIEGKRKEVKEGL